MIHHFGSPAEAAQADPKEIQELPGFGPKIIQSWRDSLGKPVWKNTWDLAERLGVQIIPYTSSVYPKRLRGIVDFPLILYVKGTLIPADHRSLAVIGTRQASIYGLEMTRKITGDLSRAGFTIVSGLARGIDTAAHAVACEQGRTLAVLGCGLGHLYPRENERLAETIISRGALISEFPITTPPDRQHFPQRNRIVSGMTLGTILMEAPKQSGAMITVGQALSQGRKVFALPGRADQDNFKGNHELIKNDQAQLIENSQDVIMQFDDLLGPLSFKSSVQRAFPQLEKEEADFIQLLPAEELSIEDIASQTKLPMAKVNVLLFSLVLKKMIKEYPGKIYKKI